MPLISLPGMVVKKIPRWSWIEIKNQVHAFNAEDQSHPHCKEIYQMLGVLMEEITWLETDTDLDALASDFNETCGYCAVKLLSAGNSWKDVQIKKRECLPKDIKPLIRL